MKNPNRKRCIRFPVWALVLVTGTILLSGATSQMETKPVWSLAATGDAILSHRFSCYDDPLFMDWVSIVRSADVGFTNLEGSLFSLRGFKGWPAPESGLGHERGDPGAAEDLKWAGFDLVNIANNHTTDWGIEGMIATMDVLDKAGLVHAGGGMTLSEASLASYLDTNKGRFALIGFATSYTSMSVAGEMRSAIKGRPGLNPLRVERKYQLEPKKMSELRSIMAALGMRMPESEKEPVRFLRNTFVQGAENKVLGKRNSDDEERILRYVNSASKQADFVVVTSHSHDSGKTRDEPPGYIKEFARKLIDAGATTYLISGPHKVRGIEIYKGKPIFYGLGDFFFQCETIEPEGTLVYEQYGLFDKSALAGDLYGPEGTGDMYGLLERNSSWWEGALAVPVFRGHELIELKIYPVELGHKPPFISGDGRAQRGTPRIAKGEMAKKIIDMISKFSEPFGTRIVFEDGIGVWKPDTSN